MFLKKTRKQEARADLDLQETELNYKSLRDLSNFAILKSMKKLKQNIYQYTAIFELNENKGYTVTVPALPGLVTEGDNLEEARDMAEDAIRCYIQGLKKASESIPPEKEVGNFRLTVRA